MADFQTVKRRGHSQSANTKYPDQHQQLVEMGFDSSSVNRALDANNGDLEAATAALIGESSNKQDAEEKVTNTGKEKKSVAATLAASVASAPPPVPAKPARQSTGLASVAAGQAVKDIKDTHQRMIATYKVLKCKESGAHDRKMCMNYHSLSDRRRNPFEILYSCYECPNTVDGGDCPDGDSCMHSHTMLERMFHPELYKISVCQRQLTGNKCDRAMLCAFAHNDADLRISPSHLTTKYAMQEEAKNNPVPSNQSAMLDHIRNNLVKLVKEHGSEGIIAADLPKYYQGKFHESLDLIDETGKKYKLKDLIGPHNNIHVVLTGQPKFVYGEPSATSSISEATATAAPIATSASEASQSSSTAVPVSQSVKDRVLELIKLAGTEGILATDMAKKYQDRYGEKLDKDWNVGLNAVAGMVLTQTKLYTKYTFNPITAGIKDAALPAPIVVKDSNKSGSANNATAASSKTAAAQSATNSSAPAASGNASSGASKWGSSAGKSFASILSATGAAAISGSGDSVPESPKASALPEPSGSANNLGLESKAPAVTSSASTVQKSVKSEKIAAEKARPSTIGKGDTKNSTNEADKDSSNEASTSATTSSSTADSILGGSSSLNTPASPATNITIGLGASPSLSRGTSEIGTSLPKPLFGGLDSQLSGLDHDQFSLTGVSSLGGNGSSSLLDLTGGSLSGLLQSSFDLPLDNMNLGANNVLPPGLSKAIGKPANVSSGSAPSLSSIIGSSLGGLTTSSRDTPERNSSAGTSHTNAGNMSQAERIAYLERELAIKSQEAESHSLETASLRSRISEMEATQLNYDERLRSSIMEKDMELITKHQEVLKYEEEMRKLKEEKLVDLDQYFIYFSKIEEVINSMKCKEEMFSDKVKPEDVQELFQFKKLIRNYVANVKVQLKNKFDAVVAQNQLLRSNNTNTVVKDPSVEAVALGMMLSSGPPPGGLTSSVSSGAISSTNATSPSTNSNVFGVLSSGTSAVGGSASSSRFAGSFDSHSVPLHNHSLGLGSVVDAFSSSSVLFPSSSDLMGSSSSGSSTVVPMAKQCGLPGCPKEGMYTCAGCRKISYCGEAHQRSHWAQHSQNCYAR